MSFLGAHHASGRGLEQILSSNATKSTSCTQIGCGLKRNSHKEHSARVEPAKNRRRLKSPDSSPPDQVDLVTPHG